ncbi:MAG: hypothetical protein R3F61_16025 [Myxococcota bacterium]
MRKTVFLAAVVLTACKGGGGPVDVEPVTFKASAPPAAVIGDLPLAVVGAHDAHVSLWGTMALLVSDPLVLDLMENQGGQSRGGVCWTSSPILSTGVDVSYDTCDLQGIVGSASVRILQGQALAMTFDPTLQYGNRTVDGSIRFDLIPGASYAWSLQPALSTGLPSPDPIQVGIGSELYEVAMEGHAALDFVNGRLAGWGNVDITGPEGTATVTYGSLDPAVADMDTATPASMKVPFFPVCRCMTGGTMAYADTSVTITRVDLNVSQALENGGTLWPEIPVDTSIEVPGKLVLTPGSECGRWAASFEPASTDAITLLGNDLRTAIENACIANAFGSEESCEAVRQGAASLSGLDLEIDATDFDRMADELADRQLDNGFCTF